ncbi:uncharacterized protein LOC101860428 isoform X2 [Aplysia californica]|uniref:Uncharacterized protein LOC101860428 isoform X2 n=1 Tax=Aplysia californica TaxID=6500 RepID=A0ABM1VXJ7_APLCA|nr:uncharacterized protein LOC101860428 isoform X2 [Aplysia californica]
MASLSHRSHRQRQKPMSYGLRMLDAALQKHKAPTTHADQQSSSTSKFDPFDVNPEDPFDVNQECPFDAIPESPIDHVNPEYFVGGSKSIISKAQAQLYEEDLDMDDDGDIDDTGTSPPECGSQAESPNAESKQNEPIDKKKPKRLCKYCNTWNSHLTRHLKRKHKDEEEVVLALKLPKKDQEKAFGALKREGIFMANMKRLESDKSAPLIRERSQGVGDTVLCSGCRGFYDAKSIFKHKRLCEKNLSDLSKTIKLNELSDNATLAGVDSDFKENILDRFRKNEVGEICRTDFVTLLFGKKQWAKSVKKERSITMSEMRVLANLILIFRQECGDEKASGHDILDYRWFDFLENAIKKMCAKDCGQDKAGLKVRIGFVLKRAVKVMRGFFVMKGDTEKEADMSRFLSVLELNWDFIFFTSQVECEQRRGGLRKPSAMPDEEDISKFRTFILDAMKNHLEQYELWDKHTFVKMRNLVVARLTMFNARRGGEPARLTLNEWKEALTGAWIDPNLVEKIDDPMEKHLIENLKLAYQSGKGSRKMVPVLITEDTLEPIAKLLSERSNCQVSKHNVFLFPNTGSSLDHASGYHCLKSVVDICPSLNKPNLLIADKFRHRVSTLYAQLELPEEQRDIFYRHMGHSETINKNVYQCPLAVREVTQVGKFLINNDGRGSLVQTNTDQGGTSYIRQTCETDNLTNEVTTQEDVCQNVSQADEMTLEEDAGQNELAQRAESVSKRARRYTRWTEEDCALIKTHFKHYITDTSNKGRLPGKKEVLAFLEKYKILEGHNDKISLVKSKVFNEKTKYRNGKFKKM